MKFILIDTNIYIYCALLMKERHDLDVIVKLTDLLKRGKAKLLLPEVIEIEYFRKQDEIINQIKEAIKSLKNQITEIKFPSYLSTDKQDILRKFDQVIEKRERNKSMVSDKLRTLFESENITHIPLTSDILLNAYKRALKGNKPFNNKNPTHLLNADYVIIESLLTFFDNVKRKDNLLFCSDNIMDFATFDKEKNVHIIHPEIAKDFQCEIILHRSLHELIEKEFRVVVDKEEIKRYEDTAKSVFIQTPEFLNTLERLKETQRMGENISNYYNQWLNLSKTFQRMNQPLSASFSDFLKSIIIKPTSGIDSEQSGSKDKDDSSKENEDEENK